VENVGNWNEITKSTKMENVGLPREPYLTWKEAHGEVLKNILRKTGFS